MSRTADVPDDESESSAEDAEERRDAELDLPDDLEARDEVRLLEASLFLTSHLISVSSLLDQNDGVDGTSSLGGSSRSSTPDPTDPDPELDPLALERRAKAQALSREEEDAFTREFSKMLLESNGPKKGGDGRGARATVPVFDEAVPLVRRAKKAPGTGEDDGPGGGGRPVEDPSSMRFMLLTKKGNKPQVRLTFAGLLCFCCICG